MFTVLDAETTWVGKAPQNADPSPYLKENYLISLGWKNARSLEYLCIQHDEQPTSPDARALIQGMLDETTLLIAHNLKFDLSWIRACGFSYSGKLYCTMLSEYIQARGLHVDLDLKSCCARYDFEGKLDIMKKYFDANITYNRVPWAELMEYGIEDIEACHELFVRQLVKLGVEWQSFV